MVKRGKLWSGLVFAMALLWAASLATAAQAAPQLDVSITAQPAKIYAHDLAKLEVTVTNTGDEPTSGPATVDVTLPADFQITATKDKLMPFVGEPQWSCSLAGNTAGCEGPNQTAFGGLFASLGPGEAACGAVGGCPLEIEAIAGDPAPGAEATVEVCGAGSASCATAAVPLEFGESGFGIEDWDGDWTVDDKGDAFTQAGGHPYEISAGFELTSHFFMDTGLLTPFAGVRNATGEFPPGLIGAPNAVDTCDGMRELLDVERANREVAEGKDGRPTICPVTSIVGHVNVEGITGAGHQTWKSPLFNMKPATGVPAQFGFVVQSFPVFLDADVRSDGDFGVNLVSRTISQGLTVTGFEATFWGVPGDSSHDFQRCRAFEDISVAVCSGTPGDAQSGPNPFSGAVKAFLTNPSSCTPDGVGKEVRLRVESWEKPSTSDEASFITHEPGDRSKHVGNDGCDVVPFKPDITLQPGTKQADSPTGLEAKIRFPQDGLENPVGIAQSALKKTVVALPEGMSVNPSYADGVQVCTPDQIGLTSVEPIRFDKSPVECPEASKIGAVKVETSLLDVPLEGGLYAAQTNDESSAGHENPFDSLIALYVVAEGAGIRVKLAGEVALDERTGQIVTSFDNTPEVPFSTFTLNFKGGPRAPLITPSTCGTFTSVAKFSPWSRPGEEVIDTDPFTITSGPGGGPCVNDPSQRPFRPFFKAGTLNVNAGSFSTFTMRLTRSDGEQELTSFDAVFPPGLLGKLAGTTKCSEAAIAEAATKTGKAEKASPSCPASSRIGTALTGAGSGQILTYVPGTIYLAGPYNGAPLSVVTIVPADVGPVDIGTVVVRAGLSLDSDDAQVHVDPVQIPFIRDGVQLHVRDIRVILDRPEFMLNPTSCDPFEVNATLLGTGGNFAERGDDVAVHLSDRFQVANCAALGFKPRLSFKLTGGTKRGGHPGLKATYRPRPGDANIKSLVVRLPRSAFLDQAHIRTICTRVQFAAESCPPGAQYGYIKAFTPLLDEPLQGPVYLRSSNNKLPDLVFDLQGIVDVEVATRIDSVRGGLRASIETAPDAPLSKVELTMQGGKKGLIVNSTNLCKGTNRAEVKLGGQNGAAYEFKPVVKPVGCGKSKKGKRGARR